MSGMNNGMYPINLSTNRSRKCSKLVMQLTGFLHIVALAFFNLWYLQTN